MLDNLLRIVLEIWPASLSHAPSGLLGRRDLRNYQRRLIGLIKRCLSSLDDKMPGIILALEPGAGKTGLVLTALRDLLDEGAIRRALITAPLLVCKTVWPAEIYEWDHLLETTFTLVRAEDSDPEIAEVSERVYVEALEACQQQFEAEVGEARRGNPSRQSALKIVRARWEAEAAELLTDEERAQNRKPKGTPADFAERHRQVAVAAAKERMLCRLVAEPTELHIVNKEALPWLWDHFRKGKDWPYDVIVADDLREGRSGKKRSKGGAKTPGKGPAPLSRWGVLAAARKFVKTTILLTGTPTPKGLENVWGLSYLIDLGERLGLNKTAFLQRWFDTNQYDRRTTPKGMTYDKKTGRLVGDEWVFRDIIGRIKDIMFSIDPAELGELPPFLLDPIKVTLPPDVLAAYKRFERDSVSEEYDVEAVNGGVLHGKLLQFANGSMYQESGDDIWVHDAKIAALQELVDRLDGTPLLVAYTYQFDVDRICGAFPDAVVLTPDNAVEVVRLWNEDKIGLLLAHRASAGHGLNMQKGTGHMCEYGLTSDAELYLQFLKRLLRPGRKTTVWNHVLIAEGTIDEDVYPQYLDPKIETQDKILNEVRLL